MSQAASTQARTDTKWRLTGRMVFLSLLAFFGVITAVNAVMVIAAVTTFGGLETASSYKAGLAFAQEEAASRAQEARHWQVSGEVHVQPNGEVRIEVVAYDAVRNPLTGYGAIAHLSHPTNRWLDRDVTLQSDGTGRYVGQVEATAGQWDLVIELTRDGERQFRSRQRIHLKPVGRSRI